MVLYRRNFLIVLEWTILTNLVKIKVTNSKQNVNAWTFQKCFFFVPSLRQDEKRPFLKQKGYGILRLCFYSGGKMVKTKEAMYKLYHFTKVTWSSSGTHLNPTCIEVGYTAFFFGGGRGVHRRGRGRYQGKLLREEKSAGTLRAIRPSWIKTWH